MLDCCTELTRILPRPPYTPTQAANSYSTASDILSYGEKRKAAMQLRRRDIQNQLSVDRREAHLLCQRTRRKNSVNHSLPENPTITVPEQSTSSSYTVGCPNQTALTIREPLSQPETVVPVQHCTLTSETKLDKGKAKCDPFIAPKIAAPGRLCPFIPQHNLDKGKAICDPFVIPEIGFIPCSVGLLDAQLKQIPVESV